MATLEAAGHRLLVPDSPGSAGKPLVICFHGSGESCSPTWDELADMIMTQIGLRVLLYDRGQLQQPKPEQATADLRAYLLREKLSGPYILIAHSYGGAFARTFMNHRNLRGDTAPDDIVGAVLVETGQEGGLDPRLEKAQYARCVLGARPLSVVRGNSFLYKWNELEAAEDRARRETSDGAILVGLGGASSEEGLRLQREMLQRSDEEDERLKKKQLGLSRNSRYVHVPDAGHNVIRDRPDIVAAEVDWVLNCVVEDGKQGAEGRWKSWRRILGGCLTS